MLRRRTRITVIGSSNTDLILQCPRLPRKGETVLGGEFLLAAGGKGANQAVAAARAGAEVIFVAKIGRDDFGRRALQGLRREGIRCRHVTTHPRAPSGVALILVGEGGENLIAVAQSANDELSPADVHRARHAIAVCDLLLLQLEIPLHTVAFAARLAKSLGKKVLLNPAPFRPLPRTLLRDVDYLTPNEHEARQLGQTSAILIETRGARGAVIPAEGLGRLVVPAFRVEAVNTVGAGDCFSGCLAVALAEGRSLLEATRFACAAAAISTTRLGAQPSMPTRREIERFMRRQRV